LKQLYTYRGDRLTRDELRGKVCEWVKRADGKCLRGKNGNAAVRFIETGEVVIVLARQLRKVPLSSNEPMRTAQE
jgi:hypothetical protein